jgi:hypothetical protein
VARLACVLGLAIAATDAAAREPEHWWKAEADARDAAGTSDGLMLNGATFGPGPQDQGLAFTFFSEDWWQIVPRVLFSDSVGDFADAPFSLSFFVQTTGHPAFSMGVLEKRESCDSPSPFWGVRIEPDGSLVFELGHDDSVATVTPVDDGRWHHVVLVRDGTEVRVFVDGSLDASATTATVVSFDNAAPVVAAVSTCRDIDRTTFVGSIDDLMTWRHALSGAEVQRLHERFRLAHSWKAEGNARDGIQGRDGILLGNVSYVPGVNGGRAFDFDGSGSSLLLDFATGNFEWDPFTIGFFVRTTSAEHQAVWEKRDICDAVDAWGFRMDQGLVGAELSNPTVELTSTSRLDDGEWHHMALVRKDRELRLYVDGVLEDSLTTSRTLYVGIDDESLHAGTSACVGVDGTVPLDGALDELTIWNVALSEDQIERQLLGP